MYKPLMFVIVSNRSKSNDTTIVSKFVYINQILLICNHFLINNELINLNVLIFNFIPRELCVK